jgi:hypothetical protein
MIARTFLSPLRREEVFSCSGANRIKKTGKKATQPTSYKAIQLFVGHGLKEVQV